MPHHRRLPPSGPPITGPTRHVPLPVLTGPPRSRPPRRGRLQLTVTRAGGTGEPRLGREAGSVGGATPTRTWRRGVVAHVRYADADDHTVVEGTRTMTAALPLRQVRRPRIRHRRVREHVHERRATAVRERAIERTAQLAGGAHELALAAERLHHLVVARLWPQLGRDRVAVEELHRMLLERPDAVVAHDSDHVDAVPRERVELHPREAEGAIAEQQHDLALGMGELGGERVARP